MSYEKSYIVGTVNTNTYRMPSESTSYTNDYHQLHDDARALAEADGINLDPYETVCVLFPSIDYSWIGLATRGGWKLWLNGVIDHDTVIHELGHNYGLSHSATWTNGVSCNPVEPDGDSVEYGDFTDIMGTGAAPEGHFNAFQKQNISWFDDDNWASVSTSGCYRVYRADHYQTTGLLRGLEIAKGESDIYWVGLRQEYPEYDTFCRGVYLVWKKDDDNRSYLLDMSPLSDEGKYDGGLCLGQTYSDSSAAVHITPTARGGETPNEWMDITVNLGSFPDNTAPTASISGPTTGAAQSSMLFTVTASDSDGDELSYYWDIGDGNVKANSPTLSASWLVGGTGTVSCVVSDMKGGTNRVSQTVVISSPLDNWTQRTSGTDESLRDITVGNGRLVVVGADAVTVYSDNATNWSLHTSFDVWEGNISLYGVIYDGSQFVACGKDYDYDIPGWEQTVYTSSDGTNWTERYTSDVANGPVNDLAYGSGVYVAVGDDGSILRSTDAINWSSSASVATNALTGVTYGDGTFVAVGNSYVLTSTDGQSWSNRLSGVDMASWKSLDDVQYCNDRFLAGGWYARILHSTDQGETFSTEMTGDRQIIPAFAYGDGSYFAAGVNMGDEDDYEVSADINFFSLDGFSWMEMETTSQDDRNAAIFFNGTFITVGDKGSIWQSDTVSEASGYAMWQIENSTELGYDRDPLEDADSDGYVNLAEYALGTEADSADSTPADGISSTTGSYFQVSHERDGIKADIDYSVKRVNNLVSNDWSSASTVVVEDSSTNLTVRSAITIDSQTNEFLRLQIQLQ